MSTRPCSSTPAKWPLWRAIWMCTTCGPRMASASGCTTAPRRWGGWTLATVERGGGSCSRSTTPSNARRSPVGGRKSFRLFPEVPMKLIERLPGVRVWLVVLAVGLQACAPVIRPTMTPSAAASHLAEFWEEPTDLETRDLLHGLWGVARAPDPNATYTFLRKKRQGNNPGVTVTDPHGREWHVKQGTEAQPEVVLSHVLWALGYHQAAEGNRLLR